MGSTGSGKTHLARRLSRRLDLPLIELDKLAQTPVTDTGDQNQAFVKAVVAAVHQDRWIMDGHYRQIRQLVWDRADLVILLDYPLLVIIRQLWQRYLAKRQRLQDAVDHEPDGIPSVQRSASWRKRLRRLFKTVAERREYRRLLAQIDNPEVQLKRFTNAAAVEAWLKTV
ncbi:MAG: hypothetical protein MUF47_02765 [Porphyrobacter sp.]|nr:hypothetical protein [Porphyrobacter sp.]